MTTRELAPDLFSDPFGERVPTVARQHLRILGGRFQFETNSLRLMRLVDSAYAGLPRHRLSAVIPKLRIKLLLTSVHPSNRRSEPPPVAMFCGADLLGGATGTSNFVTLSPRQRSALVVVSPEMLRFPFHTRYELIEFTVFTLAARSQGLVPLHAACVGRAGHGVLLMGPSGSGKSTIALLCLLQRFDFLAEDSVFVAPDTMLATGVANFLHVRADSLRWLGKGRDKSAIRKSPVIRRRSGVKKFEMDLRGNGHRLAAQPLKISAVVFLSPEHASDRSLLRPLRASDVRARLAAAQAYAANQPEWSNFSKSVTQVDGFELRRGRHPLESVDVLRGVLESRAR